jgi:hypothetical protein
MAPLLNSLKDSDNYAYYTVRFRVLTATIMKMTVFWDVAQHPRRQSSSHTPHNLTEHLDELFCQTLVIYVLALKYVHIYRVIKKEVHTFKNLFYKYY